jgi:glycosyltransferase involved in cell wall biosynthesis
MDGARMRGSSPRVVCLLPARNAANDLPAYLASAEGFCDAIVALDDGSTDETAELLEASPLVQIVLRNARRDGYQGWHDGANRNRLLREAAELEPDWIIAIDADERIEPDDGETLRRFLETDALPGCAYGLQHFRMWGGGQYDPNFHWIFRLFAFSVEHCLPDEPLHFDPVPAGMPRVRTTIRVQHLGAASEERRAARLRKYGEADPDGAYPTNFAGLSDSPTGRLALWQPRQADQDVLFRFDLTGLDPGSE